jgi:hypothetical protein
MPSYPELDRLVDIGQLDRLAPTSNEVSHLISMGTHRLTDATNESLSTESRFDLAYNAAHALALAALRKAGYRSKNRFVVFQALEHTAGMAPAEWRVLAKAHTTRNMMEYEGEGDIDDQLLAELIRITRTLGETVSRNSE